jgi:aminoglycoside phosphotransferase (APT) family kinase protein
MNWRLLVDLDRLSAWMDHIGLDRGEIGQVEPLTGGTQNILLRFSRGGRSYVLRRPPLHSIANGSETMRREARLLDAFAGTDVPHARLIAACQDEAVLGAAFYLMEPVEGFNATVRMPPLHAGDARIRRQMGFSLIDGLLALGNVDLFAAGLQDMGKLDNFLERQAGRWRKQYDAYGSLGAWTPDRLSGIDDVAAWLERYCPGGFVPGVIHGDFHIANVMYRHDGPALAAIVDWELASVGDPLVDLGWVLATWPENDEPVASLTSVEPWDGFPSAQELVSYYAAHSTRDLTALLWYKVLACYKLAILLEGSNARAMAGKAPAETGEALHAQAVRLMARAMRATQ